MSMYLLYPRLSRSIAIKLARENSILSIEKLFNSSRTNHGDVQFATTGGSRITEIQLKDLQGLVRDCARRYGYPQLPTNEQARGFDIECGILLHQKMYLYPSEASHIEMWTFIGCVLLPDVVRWRFFNERYTNPERFIGSDRGLRRNTFGRLWWRSYLFFDDNRENPYDLIHYLTEDDIGQLTDRNSISKNPILLQCFAQVFIECMKQYKRAPRRELIRETSKRLFRRLSIISYDVLDKDILLEQMYMIFGETIEVLKSSRNA